MPAEFQAAVPARPSPGPCPRRQTPDRCCHRTRAFGAKRPRRTDDVRSQAPKLVVKARVEGMDALPETERPRSSAQVPWAPLFGHELRGGAVHYAIDEEFSHHSTETDSPWAGFQSLRSSHFTAQGAVSLELPFRHPVRRCGCKVGCIRASRALDAYGISRACFRPT